MTINIRKGLFETNSSSTHSISMSMESLENLKCSIKPQNIDNKKTIVIYCGEFGWECEEYNDATTKLSYLTTYLFGGYYNNLTDDELNEIIKTKTITECHKYFFEKLNGAKQKLFNKLQQIVCDFCQCDQLLVGADCDCYPFGYIDHQSLENAQCILEKDEKYILNYIFNPNTILITDNDNH